MVYAQALSGIGSPFTRPTITHHPKKTYKGIVTGSSEYMQCSNFLTHLAFAAFEDFAFFGALVVWRLAIHSFSRGIMSSLFVYFYHDRCYRRTGVKVLVLEGNAEEV